MANGERWDDDEPPTMIPERLNRIAFEEGNDRCG